MLSGSEWGKSYIKASGGAASAGCMLGQSTPHNVRLAILRDMTVGHLIYGIRGRVILVNISCRDRPDSVFVMPFVNSLPEEIKMLPDGRTLEHERRGLLDILSYQVAFGDRLITMEREEDLSINCIYYFSSARIHRWYSEGGAIEIERNR